MVTTANSDTQHHPVFDIRDTQRRWPPEVRSLVDAVMDAVLSWATLQSNSNRDSISLCGHSESAHTGSVRLPNNLSESPCASFFRDCCW